MPEHDAEEVDFIPWSQLIHDKGPEVPRLIYVASAAVLAIAAGIVAAPRLLPASTAPPPALEQGEVVEPVVALSDETTSEADGEDSAEAVAPPSPPLLPAPDLALAMAVAEIFIQDYFTRDGDPNRKNDLAAWNIEADEAAATSYVEWARAIGVESDPDGFAVQVAFRVVTATDSGFLRRPLRFVRQRIGPAGTLLGLPTALPSGSVGHVDPTTVAAGAFGHLPPEIAAQAVVALESWEEAEPLGGRETGEGWEVVAALPDGSEVVVSIPN